MSRQVSRSFARQVSMPVAPTDSPLSNKQTVLEGFGRPDKKEVSLDIVKRRFFRLGLMIGSAGQMFVMAVIVMLLSYDPRTGAIYELSHVYYPLFRCLFLICFFAACYGFILFMWRNYQIDYRTILGVGYEHNYHYVIRCSTGLISVVFLMFTLYVFTLTADVDVHIPSKHLWPALSVGSIFVFMLWPTDMNEWKGSKQRYSLFVAVFMTLMSPFSQPYFSRTFVADVLTSMPKVFGDAQFTTCIYLTGEAFDEEWIHGRSAAHEACNDTNATYKNIHLCLAVLPFWIRLMQCVRGFAGSWKLKHIPNGIKYCTSMAVVISSFRPEFKWQRAWLAISVISSVYAYCWDIVMDWGLGPSSIRRLVFGRTLGRSSQEPFLRANRYYPNRFYYFAMITNGIARFGWAIYISPGQHILKQHFVLLLGVVEMLRRTQWALLRLEWEHICTHCEKDATTLISVEM